MVQKRIILANDLSGIGKVALTPAIPIMACCQIETILLPTILLSSHTGGFGQIAIQELLLYKAKFRTMESIKFKNRRSVYWIL